LAPERFETAVFRVTGASSIALGTERPRSYRQFLTTSGTMPCNVPIWPVAMPFASKADRV